MAPLVSICIPAYNAERFIRETLDSAVAQTYPNLEIIVSDDCSTDSTREIVRGYIHRGVRIIEQPRNLGMHGNWNAVIRSSAGKYVLKLDADDQIDPEHVSAQVDVMEANPEVAFAHCACRLIDANGKFLGYERSLGGSFIRSGIEEWPRYVLMPRAINIVTLRRELFNKVGGYDERYRYSGDWAMHRALLRVGSVFYNDKILATYRSHSVGKKGVKLLQAHEHLMHFEEMERNWPADVPDKEQLLQRAKILWGIEAVRSAAYVDSEERAQILALLPRYGHDWRIEVISALVKNGGSPLVRIHYKVWLASRQGAKALLKLTPRFAVGGWQG